MDSAELRVGFINRVLDLRFLPQGLKSVRENSSFAPLGGIISDLYPRFTRLRKNSSGNRQFTSAAKAATKAGD